MQQITASNWQLLSPLLDDALLLSPAARLAWLTEQTQLTAANHAHLARLVALANAPETDHVFQELTGAIGAPTPRYVVTQYAHADEQVGPYQLLRLLGRGGMAEVWLARRSDGAYQRDVALKLPLAHLPQNVAAERLLRERNVLAALEHPSIARLYDAGVAANGQPYLAMEYVEGESILNHANRLQLDLKARAQLMLAVLDALHYAHQHLIVHRDLKPSNIMVRPDGRVTLLDFGIAKVLESATAATQATELTQAAGTALTLAYAAPEQLLAEPVTTATDVYSAGVVMFELLTGARPFAHAERSPSALLQAIDAATAPLPVDLNNDVTALAHGYDSASVWARAYQGDLAAICARALRREPAARYASALSMHDDLARYFDDQPVQARSGAWSYRWRKFFDRNRTAVIVSTAAALATAGFGAHAWQQRQDSRVSTARATAIESVVKSLFDGMNPNSNTARSFTAKELLDKSRPLMLQAGAMNADSASRTRLMMAKLYLDIAAFDDASKLLVEEIADARAAVDVRREVWAQCLLADVDIDRDAYATAYAAMSRAASQLGTGNGQSDVLAAEVNYRLGSAAFFLQKLEEAEQHLQQALAVASKAGIPAIELHANVLLKLGSIARLQGDASRATEYFSRAQTQLQGTSGMQLTKDAVAIEMLPMLFTAGRYDETIKQAEALLDQFATRSAADAAFPIATAVHYASALVRTGRFLEAAKQAERITASAPKSDDGARYQARFIEAQIALFSGQINQAETKLNALLGTTTAKPSGLFYERVRRNLAHNLLHQGRNAEALTLLRDIERTQAGLVNDTQNPDLAVTRVLIGVALLRQGDIAGAKPVLLSARDAMQATRGARHFGTLLAESYLALITAASGAPASNATLLADRVDRELGWQHGASELAARLRKPALTSLITVPAVL